MTTLDDTKDVDVAGEPARADTPVGERLRADAAAADANVAELRARLEDAEAIAASCRAALAAHIAATAGSAAVPAPGTSQRVAPERPREVQQITITTTKRGLPAMWESGGGYSNTGRAQVVAGRRGEARRPVYLRRGGDLACGDHALITVHEGYHVVSVSQHRGDFSITVSRILRTTVQGVQGDRREATADVEVLTRFSRGEWDAPLDPMLEAAVEAAKRKSRTYHCRGAVFIDDTPKPEAPQVTRPRGPRSPEAAARAREQFLPEFEKLRPLVEQAGYTMGCQSTSVHVSRDGVSGGLGPYGYSAEEVASLEARTWELLRKLEEDRAAEAAASVGAGKTERAETERSRQSSASIEEELGDPSPGWDDTP